MAAHRLGFSTVYRALSDAAGSSRFRSMTKAQVRQAEPVAQWIANGAATEQDWQLIEAKRVDKPVAPQQHQLSFPPDDSTAEEGHDHATTAASPACATTPMYEPGRVMRREVALDRPGTETAAAIKKAVDCDRRPKP